MRHDLFGIPGYLFDRTDYQFRILLHDPVIAVPGEKMFALREAGGNRGVLRTAALRRGARRKNDHRLIAKICGPVDAGGARGEIHQLARDCQRELRLYPEYRCHCFFVCRQGREPRTGNGSRLRRRSAADHADEMRAEILHAGGEEKGDETNQTEASEKGARCNRSFRRM